MTILTLDRKELEKKIGKIDKKLKDKITEMGTPVEELTDDELSVEVFPNRPDLLSMENFARAVNQFNGKSGVSKFKINPPEKDYKITIEKAVKQVRPYTACAIVKGIKFDDKKIKNIIEIQEKLHDSIGRKRKKVAIGIYPLEKIKFPIRFTAKKPQEIKFRPLESPREMTGSEILRHHQTGIEYSKLLEGSEVFPVFIDADDKILSMPPIINSEDTGRIKESTKEVFIECSGHNLFYLKKTLNIILSAFSEMGGRIYSIEIRDQKDGNWVSPQMEPEKVEFKISDIENLLGIKLSKTEIKTYLGRMGIGCEFSGDKSTALVPCYRVDILHWIDLVEEIAIAYGYENFEPEIPNISTIGSESKVEKLKRLLSEILTGIGLLEVSSFHLTTKKNIKKMHYDFKDFVELEDSKTERNVLRMDLLTNLLQIFFENSNASYPQKLFEIGRVFEYDDSGKSETKIREKERLAIAIADDGAGFTDLKQIADYLFKMLDVEYSLEPVENSNYIAGRVGVIRVGGKGIGFIGEVAPRVLKNWKIKMPVVAMEIDIDFLISNKINHNSR